MKKKFLLMDTIKLSFFILINKPIGLLRDILKVRYFGIGVMGDAFSMAWRIPNMLRRIFSEGALTSVLIPALVQGKDKYGENEMNSFLTLVFVFMQCLVALLCYILSCYSVDIISFIAPGSVERVVYAAPMFKILIFFTLFMSMSSVLGGALQIVRVFSIGPLSQFFLNVALCCEYIFGIYLNLSIITVCWMILLNGLIIFFMHYFLYLKNGFKFALPTKNSFCMLSFFLKRLFPVFFSAGTSEINMMVDQAIASYLPAGSQSLLDCVSGFVRIPMQVIGSSFATVSAPQFAKISIRRPMRLSFYMLETLKLILWASLVGCVFFYFFSKKILITIFLSDNFTMDHVVAGSTVLILLSPMILFAGFNRVILNAYYANNMVLSSTLITLACGIFNTVFNILLMADFKLNGIVFATVIAEAIRTLILLIYLKIETGIHINIRHIVDFFFRCALQLFVFVFAFSYVYRYVKIFMENRLGDYYSLFNDSFLYWIVFGPIFIIFAALIFYTRRYFGIRLYYLK